MPGEKEVTAMDAIKDSSVSMDLGELVIDATLLQGVQGVDKVYALIGGQVQHIPADTVAVLVPGRISSSSS